MKCVCLCKVADLDVSSNRVTVCMWIISGRCRIVGLWVNKWLIRWMLVAGASVWIHMGCACRNIHFSVCIELGRGLHSSCNKRWTLRGVIVTVLVLRYALERGGIITVWLITERIDILKCSARGMWAAFRVSLYKRSKAQVQIRKPCVQNYWRAASSRI